MASSETQGAFQNAANGTDVVLQAGIPGARIAVYAAIISSSAGSTVTFNSKGSGAGTAISGGLTTAANGGFVLPPSGGDEAWFSTNVGEALTVTCGAATSVTVAFKVLH